MRLWMHAEALEVGSSSEDVPLRAARRRWPLPQAGRRLATVAAAAATLVLLGSLAVGLRPRSGSRSHLVPRQSEVQEKAELAPLPSVSLPGLQPAPSLPGLQPAPSPAAKKPNIVFVLIDDLGFADFRDSKDLGPSWPYVKSIAKDAIMVNTTYTEAWCSPSRAAFLTGRYHHLLSSNEFSSKDETTIAQKLNGVGYKSYAIGKWHVGWASWALNPMGRGFLRYFGNLNNPNDHYTHCSTGELGNPTIYFDFNYMESHPFVHNDSSATNPYCDVAEGSIGKYDAEVFDQVAAMFLLEHKDKFPDDPFFLYYAMYADHHPYQADVYWKTKCQDVITEGRQNICGMQTAVDTALRNLTNVMNTHFPDDNYVVIITGDNGGMIGKGATVQGWSNNAPLRGRKFFDWEGGVHSRAYIYGKHPDLQASSMLGKTYMGGFMHLVDWHATIAELGGAPLDGLKFPASGKSVWRALLHNEPSPRQSIAIDSGFDGMAYFRSGDWVLMAVKDDFGAEATKNALPVYPLPKHNYSDTLSAYKEYLGNHPPDQVTLPALFNIWTDRSMSVEYLNSTKKEEMVTLLARWFNESGTKSTASDLDCPNESCKAMREAAKENVTVEAAAGLHGEGVCAERSIYPYWDVPSCSCEVEVSA